MLTNTAEGFSQPKRSRLMSCWVWGVRGACRLTTSAAFKAVSTSCWLLRLVML